MTDLPQPTSIRRTICFSEAIINGTARVEDITGRHAKSAEEAREILSAGEIAVLADPTGTEAKKLAPDAVVDAILAKRNIGTSMKDAEIVVGVGPGFTAGWLSRGSRDHARTYARQSLLRRLRAAEHRRAGQHRRVHAGAHSARAARGRVPRRKSNRGHGK
jgi:hypothetical protein